MTSDTLKNKHAQSCTLSLGMTTQDRLCNLGVWSCLIAGAQNQTKLFGTKWFEPFGSWVSALEIVDVRRKKCVSVCARTCVFSWGVYFWYRDVFFCGIEVAQVSFLVSRSLFLVSRSLHSVVQHLDCLLLWINKCVLFWASTSCKIMEVKEDLDAKKKIKKSRYPRKDISIPTLALGEWGRTQKMGSDGFNRILLFQPCRGTRCTSENT